MVVIGGSRLCRLIEANRRCHQTWHGDRDPRQTAL